MNMRSYNCCLPSEREYCQISSLSLLLKLIAEPSRLKILCILRNGTHCVCELEEHTLLSQSLISHHLKDLRDAGILRDEKKQQRIYYSLTEHGLKITDHLFQLPISKA